MIFNRFKQHPLPHNQDAGNRPKTAVQRHGR